MGSTAYNMAKGLPIRKPIIGDQTSLVKRESGKKEK